MSELKEFTAAEMRNCPDFGEFNKVVGGHILMNTEAFGVVPIKVIKCNPIHRMNAIAKHLFELMPYKDVIEIWNEEVYIYCSDLYSDDDSVRLSINPFLHTDRTEITREELVL